MTAEHQSIDAVIEQVTALRAAYTDRYHATESSAVQQLIECHSEPLCHAIDLLEEVRDILAAEQQWGALGETIERR